MPEITSIYPKPTRVRTAEQADLEAFINSTCQITIASLDLNSISRTIAGALTQAQKEPTVAEEARKAFLAMEHARETFQALTVKLQGPGNDRIKQLAQVVYGRH